MEKEEINEVVIIALDNAQCNDVITSPCHWIQCEILSE